MKWKTGWDRQEEHLLPERVEDYVEESNPVRFLEAFVEGQDLKAAGFLFPKENAEGRGRPAYRPADLLKLYLYGYLHQIRSSRRLEEECQRNLEVMWLVGKLTPDFKTIADFRKDNAGAFKGMVRQFNLLCQELGLFGKELLAVDGTKIKGQNARDKNWSQKKLQEQLQQAEEKVAEYLKALEKADQAESTTPKTTGEELRAKINQWQERQKQVQARQEKLQTSAQTQLSETDADSRGMKSSSGHVVGYNVQGAVDSKHHLLIVAEATNAGADQGQLAPIVKAAKQELKIQQADVVADGGYYKGRDIKACQDMNMEPHLPTVCNSPSERAGLYGKNDFGYDAQKDSYCCPAGAELTLRRRMDRDENPTFNYNNPDACRRCPLKANCTEADYRTISRGQYEQSQTRMALAVKAAPEKLALRKTLIEHVWGTFKWLLPGGFLLKGLEKVQAEVSLIHFSYNFKRAMAVVGLEKLLQAMKSRSQTVATSRA